MQENIDIVISDKIAPDVERKINAIEASAKEAHISILKVQTALNGLGKGNSTSKLIAEMNRIETSNKRAAIASTQLETAQARLAAAHSRAATASTRAATAEVNLLTAQQRLVASTNRAEASIERLNRAKSRTAKGGLFELVNGLKRAHLAFLGILAVGAGVATFFNQVDTYIGLENRLKSTGTAASDVSRQMKELTAVAKDSRSSLQGTVELFSRLRLATREKGYSEDSLLTFTKSLNKSILMSGATAAEANNALIQMSQGMSSNRLSGDELRSVLEQLPVVADVIAEKLKVGRGELRKLGAEGKISTDVIMQAFLDAAPRIEEQFKQVTLTVGQAFENLKTTILTFDADVGREGLFGVAGMIQDISNTFEDASKTGSIFSEVIRGLVVTVNTFYLGLEAGYNMLFPVLLGSAGHLLALLAEKIMTHMQYMIYGIQLIAKASGIQTLQDAINPVGNAVRRVLQDAKELNATFGNGMGEWAMSGVDSLSRIGDRLGDLYGYKPPRASGEPPQRKLPKSSGSNNEKGEKGEKVAFKWTVTYVKMDQSIKDSYAEMMADLEKETSRIGLSDKDLAFQDKMDSFKKGLPDIQEYERKLSSMAGRLEEINNLEASGVKLTRQEVAERFRLMEGVSRQRGIIDSVRKSNEEDLKLIEARVRANMREQEIYERRKAIMDAVKPKDSFKTTLEDLDYLEGRGQRRDQSTKYLMDTNSDLFGGTKEQMNQFVNDYRDMLERIRLLRESNRIDEDTGFQMSQKAWILRNQAMYENTSEFFGNLSVLQESENRKVAAVGKAFAVNQAVIDGILAVQKVLANIPPPGSYALAASMAVATTANVMKIQGIGFRNGGYTGFGNPDEAAGLVHRGEYVMRADTVNRLGVDNLNAIQNGSMNYSNSQSVNIVNVLDMEEVGNYLQSSSGETVVMNVIRKNPNVVKALVNQ